MNDAMPDASSLDRRFERPTRIACADPRYPARLHDVPDPPGELWAIGDLSVTHGPAIAIIGSRKATPYGLSCARRFAGWCAAHRVTVISGAAIGCDLAAHEGALEHGTRTVAVLACGPDVDYPRRAAPTLTIIRRGGLVCSESPPGTPPKRWAFPRRNRIIAGLADAVLVVEAGLPSGTFSTADHALESGREVLAVPGSIHSPTSRGTNRLIRQGAAPVTCEEDLEDLLGLLDMRPSDRVRAADASALPDDPLLQALRADPMRPEQAAHFAGLPLSVALARLTRLETRGLVARYPDGRYGPL